MDQIKIAQRMEKVHSDIRGPVFMEANRMAAAGTKVLRLNTGNPATFGFTMPDSVRQGVASQLDRAVAYCDLKGMPDARQAIYDYHRSKGLDNFCVDDIFITNGVSEAAGLVTTVLLNPGDELLMPSPSYSLWSNQAHICGATPVFYTCDEQSNWYPDLADIRSKVTSRTRAILIINPNNPTGAVYPREVLQGIVDIAREHDLVILSDEIYDRLLMDGVQHLSTAVLAPDLPVITFNGLSKSHIICGFRCGWLCITGPDALTLPIREAIQKLAAMRLCANAVTQLAIPYALADDASTQAMMVPGGRIYEQREATCRALDQIEGISYVKNRAAFYLFPRIDTKRFNITNDRQFAMDVLHGTNILFVPGSGFDWPTPDHFRLVMLPDPDTMSDAMQRFGQFLSTYRQD